MSFHYPPERHNGCLIAVRFTATWPLQLIQLWSGCRLPTSAIAGRSDGYRCPGQCLVQLYSQ